MKEQLNLFEIHKKTTKLGTIAFKAFTEFTNGDTDKGIATVEEYKVVERELLDFITKLTR